MRFCAGRVAEHVQLGAIAEVGQLAVPKMNFKNIFLAFSSLHIQRSGKW
jgi:hypothetical protein